MLQDIEKKDFFFDKTENQKEQIASDIEKGKLEDAKKPKKNKSIEAQKSAKEQEKNKVQSAAAVKAEKKKVNLKSEEGILLEASDGILKKSSNFLSNNL